MLTDRCVWVPQNSASVAFRASTALFAFWFRVYFCTVDIWLLLIRSWFGDLSASDRPRLARGEANPILARNRRLKLQALSAKSHLRRGARETHIKYIVFFFFFGSLVIFQVLKRNEEQRRGPRRLLRSSCRTVGGHYRRRGTSSERGQGRPHASTWGSLATGVQMITPCRRRAGR